MSDLLLIQFQRLNLDVPSVIMTYAPIEDFKEFDPELVVEFLQFRNPELIKAYSVMDSQQSIPALKVIVVNEDTVFETKRYGINEPVNGKEIHPEEIDCVITPLLCFDMNGNRVGYGKGFYDYFFKNGTFC